jgi:LPXTG-motif cell wall-anchored protein
MWRLIGLLLVVWLVVTVVGAVIEGLFWLAVLGALFFLGTAVLGWNRRRNEVGGGRRALR